MPTKPPQLTNKNAQHTLEYMILLILIMAGIIIGGPYVIRSWNAQVKGWEDSVIDSMTDPLVEAPVTAVSIPGCDFVSWQNQACGLGYTSPFGDSVNCTPQQLLQMGVFNPDGCQFNNPSTPFSNIAQCDTNDANHCCTSWVTPSGCNPDDAGCPLDSDCGVNVGCPDGQYHRTHTCDTGYTETECVADPACDFTCNSTGLPGPNGATGYGDLCPGSDTGLSGDTNYSYTNPGNCTGAKCQIQCSPTFVWNGINCACPTGQTVSGGVCVCASGWAYQDGCSAGYCYQGSCGAGYCRQ